MTPCRDCTLTHPRAATHTLYFRPGRHCWEIDSVPRSEPRARYCRWHATVRATQRNAALRRRGVAKEKA